MFKKLLMCSIAITVILFPNNVLALDNIQEIEIEYLEDGSYFETILEVFNYYSTTKTGKKTSTYKNSSGSSLWSVSVTGTFTYNGSTSQCTSSSVSTTIYNNSWKISEKSSSKSGNTAKAQATAKEYLFDTIVLDTISRSVSLTCDKNGNLS